MNRKEELKKAYLAGFVEGGIIKTLKGIKYHLIIEDMADEYAEQQINLTIPIVGVSLKITDEAKEKLDYILGHSITRDFPETKPTLQWVGAVLDFLEIVGISK